LSRQGKDFKDFAYLEANANALFDQLVWWAEALKAAREQIPRGTE